MLTQMMLKEVPFITTAWEPRAKCQPVRCT